MSRKLIKLIPYNQVQFKWVENNDIFSNKHLNGTCIYKGRLHEFENEDPYDEFDSSVSIYRISIIDKLKWIWKQWIYEVCIGNYFTYKNGKPYEGAYFGRKKRFDILFLKIYVKLKTL